MICHLSQQQFESPSRVSSHSQLQKTFRSLDQQNSGKIKKSVILSATMYTSDFYDRKVIEEQLKKCPQQITFQKFTSIFQTATVNKQDTSSTWIFKLYDKDTKGYIDKGDLLRASQMTGIQLSEEQMQSMLQAQNPLLEGKVYFDDFAEIMNTQIQFQ